jgi:hypothetical protein
MNRVTRIFTVMQADPILAKNVRKISGSHYSKYKTIILFANSKSILETL